MEERYNGLKQIIEDLKAVAIKRFVEKQKDYLFGVAGYQVYDNHTECKYCGCAVHRVEKRKTYDLVCSACSLSQIERKVATPKIKEEIFLTLDECLEELIDEMEKDFLTPVEIGKKLLKNKLNNEKNMLWARTQLSELGVAVRVK